MNQDGFNLLKTFEGLKLTSYQDSGGIWTVGYGHTSGVTSGMTITQDQADDFLASDIALFESIVTKVISRLANQNQFCAAVCFAYNVRGWSGTPLFKLLSDGNFEGAKAHWLFYDRATIDGQKVIIDGLTKRREAELALFCKPAPVVVP